MSTDRDEVKALLSGSIETLARELAPDGYRSGRYWMAKCPWRPDRNGGSFWITISGAYAGAWKDAAGGDEDKGDVFNLIDRAIGLNGDFRDILRWARGWLGIGDMPAEERARRAAHFAGQQRQADADAAEQLERYRRRAKALFVEARRQPFVGSVAERYLRSRGIDVRQLRDHKGKPRLPGAIGSLAATKHHESGRDWPCLVALMTAADGTAAAIHRTFIAPDGSGKASVRPARKIWPSFDGATIRLWRGSSGLDVNAAAANGLIETLVLCEGVEDGLSLALASPEFRIWCAGTLGNLSKIALPACIDDVIVVADNDWGKPQAMRALDHALDCLSSQGASVRVARSHIGKDANDALRGVSG